MSKQVKHERDGAMSSVGIGSGDASSAAAKASQQLAELEATIARVKSAQAVYASYTQEQVDAIFRAAALAANDERIVLAKMAVAETGMGIIEDKVIKNHFAPNTSTTSTSRPRRAA